MADRGYLRRRSRSLHSPSPRPLYKRRAAPGHWPDRQHVVEPMAGMLVRVLESLRAQGAGRPKTVPKLTNALKSFTKAVAVVSPAQALQRVHAKYATADDLLGDVLVTRRVQVTARDLRRQPVMPAALRLATRRGAAVLPVGATPGGPCWRELLEHVRQWAAGCTAPTRRQAAAELAQHACLATRLSAETLLEVLVAHGVLALAGDGVTVDYTPLLYRGTDALPAADLVCTEALLADPAARTGSLVVARVGAVLLAHAGAGLPATWPELCAWLQALGADQVVLVASPQNVLHALGGKLNVRTVLAAAEADLKCEERAQQTLARAEREAAKACAVLALPSDADLAAATAKVEQWLAALPRKAPAEGPAGLPTVDELCGTMHNLCVTKKTVAPEELVAKLLYYKLIDVSESGAVTYRFDEMDFDWGWLLAEQSLIKATLARGDPADNVDRRIERAIDDVLLARPGQYKRRRHQRI